MRCRIDANCVERRPCRSGRGWRSEAVVLRTLGPWRRLQRLWHWHLVQLRCQERYDGSPCEPEALAWRWWLWRRRIFEDNVCPPLEDGLRNMELPADLAEEGALVGVDLRHFEAGHFAPSFGGVVAVLQVLRGKDKCRQEHASSAHQCAGCRTVHALLLSEVRLWYLRSDQDQVIQRHLERRV